jgi:hypothetical protein
MISGALVACIASAIHAWAAPYAMRALAMSPGTTGLSLGLTGSLATGIVSVLGLIPVIVVVLLLAARRLPHETLDGRRARAEAAGKSRDIAAAPASA